EYFTQLIASNEITFTDFVPSVFNFIVPQLLNGSELKTRLDRLRCIIIGGEEITPATTYSFMEHFPTVRVFNLYGPTEASIGCICYEVNRVPQSEQRNYKIPIGKPIANTHALVLDQQRQLAPIGVPGELHLSGVCLSLGYLNDEEKTQAAFIENPFAEIGWSKLYKTGDLARYLADGNLEFLGRRDQQVKIRGHRIELGEIEATLTLHELVKEAVVVTAGENGHNHLVAYVVAQALNSGAAAEQLQLNGAGLREYLRTRLPSYMIPSKYVLLDRLPLTPNGKVDRRALPEPAREQGDDQKAYALPRTPAEKVLVEVFKELLTLDRVGVQDNVFEIGGDSILSIQLVSRARQA